MVVPVPARVGAGLRALRERLPAVSFPLGPRQEPVPEQRWLVPVAVGGTEVSALCPGLCGKIPVARGLCARRRQKSPVKVTLFLNKERGHAAFAMRSLERRLLFILSFPAASSCPFPHWLRYLEGSDFPIHRLHVPLNMHPYYDIHLTSLNPCFSHFLENCLY